MARAMAESRRSGGCDCGRNSRLASGPCLRGPAFGIDRASAQESLWPLPRLGSVSPGITPASVRSAQRKIFGIFARGWTLGWENSANCFSPALAKATAGKPPVGSVGFGCSPSAAEIDPFCYPMRYSERSSIAEAQHLREFLAMRHVVVDHARRSAPDLFRGGQAWLSVAAPFTQTGWRALPAGSCRQQIGSPAQDPAPSGQLLVLPRPGGLSSSPSHHLASVDPGIPPMSGSCFPQNYPGCTQAAMARQGMQQHQRIASTRRELDTSHWLRARHACPAF